MQSVSHKRPLCFYNQCAPPPFPPISTLKSRHNHTVGRDNRAQTHPHAHTHKNVRLDIRVCILVRLPDIWPAPAVGFTRAFTKKIPVRKLQRRPTQCHGHCVDFGLILERQSHERIFIARASVHFGFAGYGGIPNLTPHVCRQTSPQDWHLMRHRRCTQSVHADLHPSSCERQ
jgi:hypothetical protein